MVSESRVLEVVKPKYDEDGRRDLIDEINQLRDLNKSQFRHIASLKQCLREIIMYYNVPQKQEIQELIKKKPGVD